MKIDETDQAIIRFLADDARASYSEISKAIGVSVGTVRNRLTQLRESGALHLNLWLDPNRVGLGVTATCLFKVQAGKLDSVVEALVGLSSTGYVAVLAGNHDLVVDVFCRDVPHLNEVLQKELQTIEGVLEVTSYVVTEIKYQSSADLAALFDEEPPAET